MYTLRLTSDLKIPQTLNDKLLTRGATVNILDIICCGLEVASGVVALGDEDVVVGAILKRLIKRDGRAL